MVVLTLDPSSGSKQYYVNYGNSYALDIPDFDLKTALPTQSQ